MRNKVTFDFHQTNPQLDVQPTGHCKYWVHEVCLMDQIAQPNQQDSQPISYSTVLAACVYGTDGKCKGMLTPKRLQILHQKYNEAKSTGLHHNVSPPLQSFASELVGLFVRKARAAKQYDSKKIKDSFHRILPPHVIAAFKHCAAVTQEKMASPLDFNPDLPHYWSSHPRNTMFGAFLDYFSSSFSGFSICHPTYDDDIMHLTLRHAIYSAINSLHHIPTATFMLLPCWGRSMSTNAYMALYNQFNHMCSLMKTISSQNLQYTDIPFWNDSRTPLPKHHWDLQIIAVWNTQARLNLNNRNPEWLNHLAQSIPEAKWNTTRVISGAHICMPLGTSPPGLNKLKRLKPDHLLVAKRHNHDTSLQSGQMTTTQIQDKSSPHLTLQIADWKKIAYTDGSCIRRDHQQIIGAGVYIPDTECGAGGPVATGLAQFMLHQAQFQL